MAESYSKSKLKRKKPSAEEFRSEMCSRGAKRSSLTSSSRDGGANTDGSAGPPAAAPWWRTAQPPAVESLWACTLMSALQNLENQLWDPVPDLPPPPAADPPAPNPDEQRWGDLGWEVPPLPECSLLCPRSSLIRASSQLDLPVQTKTAQNPPDRSQNCLAEPPQLQQHGEEATSSSSAGRRRVGGEIGPTIQEPKVSAPAEEEEAQRRDEEPQSCPLCLRAFPPGSTQMDRDGHLAQCLSELDVDMTW
ncbi:Fanconi anemia core complex-associated protein 20 [Nematolebias whitei]|uniref:Fanconi anemia core complex-associated protein 20 n=1 Tax=Nematolebias whitei TaxID=451745 RepID=UPI00189BA3F9|nr:Fanconi anemia core complex-associated protein 20 [Nematolebias whitei]